MTDQPSTPPPDNVPGPNDDTKPALPPAKKESDKTQPIRLVPTDDGRFNLKRKPGATQIPISKPDPKAETKKIEASKDPTPPMPNPTPDDAAIANDPWMGREKTMVGTPIDPNLKKDAPAADANKPWLGQEKTMLGMPAGPKKNDDNALWLGQEKTMVGAPIDPALKKPNVGKAEEWLGREATMVGVPTGEPAAGGADKPKDVKRKTTATMDDGWHLKGRQGPMTGQVMGDYEIGGILGEGGMGTVYRAKQISLKRRVALKVLPPALANDARLKVRFEQEARTASLVVSPHVIQVYAAGSYNDNVFFVMEYVEGTDLSEIIRQKEDAKTPFTPDECATYIIQAARGLAEAGKHGIVHRDIKPPNLMVTTKGVLKIADFGISKVAGEHSLTMTGTAVGTPAYVSPEQGRGDAVDPRSDLYSLGIVFYELLTGQKPFDGATPNALIYQHNYTEPKLPSEIRPDIPEAYQAIVLKCMQKDPAKRYQDAGELVNDLERVRAGSAPMTALLSAFGTGADEAMKRLGIKQRKTWPLLIAAMLLFTVGGGGYWYWQSGESVRQQRVKDEQKYRANLQVLNKAAPVNKSARDDLDRLTKMVGSSDADVKRWSKKLKDIEDEQKILSELDTVRYAGRELRQKATTALTAYKENVGSTGEDTQRWQAVLDETEAQEKRLREELVKEMDVPNLVVDIELKNRVLPQVAELKRIAGESDSDAARWEKQFTDYDDAVKAFRARLAKLDAALDTTRETELKNLEADLADLSKVVDSHDEDVQRWSQQIDKGKSNLVNLRATLKALDDQTGVITVATQAALGPDLETFSKIADENDPDLKSWGEKLRKSQDTVKELRASFDPLKEQGLLTNVQAGVIKNKLDEYAKFVGAEDTDLLMWRNGLEAKLEIKKTMIDNVKKLDLNAEGKAVDLSESELSSCDEDLKKLLETGWLVESQKIFYTNRIEQEKQSIEKQYAALKSLDSNGKMTVITKPLAEQINAFLDRVGETGRPEVKKWSDLASGYNRLHHSLEPLDKAVPVPKGADKLLEDFEKFVGSDDIELKRWRTKVLEEKQLRTDLASITGANPLPDEAKPRIDRLVELVGPDEPVAAAWKKEVYRVIELKDILGAMLPHAYLLPSDGHKLFDELKTFVGDQDADVQAWAVRLALLDGPPKPEWAQEFDNDQYGFYAKLQLAEDVVQTFRYIPAGDYVIGSPFKESGREKDENQVKMALTHSFWLADSECTNAMYAKIMRDNPSKFRGHDYPVERVSWNDCQDFIKKLNAKVPGLNAKLPTETQWEYACRVGKDVPFISYDEKFEQSKVDTICWSVNNSADGAKGVKRRFPNPLGLHDMHGNVWEWCEDKYGVYPPTGASDYVGNQEETRVARGGSWGDDPGKCRAANRLAVRPDMKTVFLGFRICAPVQWPEGKEPGQHQARTAMVDK